NTIQRYKPAVLAEVLHAHLHRANSSADELFDIMEVHGYRAYHIGTRRIRLRHRLFVAPLTKRDPEGMNVLWIHPDSPHQSRLFDRARAERTRSPIRRSLTPA